VDIYLRTRGLDKDYRFLGEAPAEFWWRQYRAWTDTEGPTILLESGADYWRAYLAGITSTRRDLSDRPIQFNLAFAGAHETTDAEARELMLAVLARSLADLAASAGGSISGAALDERLPQGVVERMLAGPAEETWQEAAQAVRSAYGGEVVAEADVTDFPQAWAAGIANETGRGLFLSCAAEMLGGKAGHALVLNLMATPADAADLPGNDSPGLLALLAARPGARLDEEVTALEVKKAEPPRFPGQHQRSSQAGKTGPHRRSPHRGTGLGRTSSPGRRMVPAGMAGLAVLAALTLLAALTFGVIRIDQAHSARTPVNRPSSQPPTVTRSLTSTSRSLAPSPVRSPRRRTSGKPSSQPTP